MQWPLAQRAIALYTFIAKGIPVYVHILIAYFVVPLTIGINIPPFIAGTLALAFCSSGYVTDIISAGIDAVNEGQQQAAFVLGYTNLQCMQRIILPQALTIIRPALFGECEQLLKSSSLLATIGIVEITRAGMNIISRELNPIPVYIMIACIYLFFSALLCALKTYILSKETYA
jgi:ABC-type amino acid transport system permease subunit